MTDFDHRVLDRRPPRAPSGIPVRSGRSWGGMLGAAVLVLLLAALASGVWRHYREHRQIVSLAEQHRDFVPSVRVAAVRASPPTFTVALPATTSPFASANIFARASGYIAERGVDIARRSRRAINSPRSPLPSSTTRSRKPRRRWRRTRHRTASSSRTGI